MQLIKEEIHLHLSDNRSRQKTSAAHKRFTFTFASKATVAFLHFLLMTLLLHLRKILNVGAQCECIAFKHLSSEEERFVILG